MLRFQVPRYVLEKTLLVVEAFVTAVTFVGLVKLMAARV